MIESIDNCVQLAILGLCAGISIHKALMLRTKEWAMLAIFFSGFFMGNLYWQLFLQFYGETPTIFYVADLNWYVSDFFLFLLLKTVTSQHSPAVTSPKKLLAAKWAIVIFVAAMCVYFMQWGDYVSNIIAATLMALIAIRAVRGIWFLPGFTKRRLCIFSFVFVVSEYALWIGSCFLEGDSLDNPYYWFDVALTVTFLLILIAALRELSEANDGNKTRNGLLQRVSE